MSAGNNITKKQYEEEVPEHFDTWRRLAQKYLEGDVKATWEVVLKLAALAWDEFKVNFHQSLTAPSIAKKVWARNYNQLELVANIDPSSWVDHLIRSAYYGGVQEVLAPYIKDGHEFDVNSEYPYCMKQLMPAGNPTLVHKPSLEEVVVNNKVFMIC
jgi:hypothetical protein